MFWCDPLQQNENEVAGKIARYLEKTSPWGQFIHVLLFLLVALMSQIWVTTAAVQPTFFRITTVLILSSMVASWHPTGAIALAEGQFRTLSCHPHFRVMTVLILRAMVASWHPTGAIALAEGRSGTLCNPHIIRIMTVLI